MRTWCEVRNFASQKFRLTPDPDAGVDSGRILRFSFGPGVKQNFWPLRNVWPVVVFQLFCFSE